MWEGREGGGLLGGLHTCTIGKGFLLLLSGKPKKYNIIFHYLAIVTSQELSSFLCTANQIKWSPDLIKAFPKLTCWSLAATFGLPGSSRINCLTSLQGNGIWEFLGSFNNDNFLHSGLLSYLRKLQWTHFHLRSDGVRKAKGSSNFSSLFLSQKEDPRSQDPSLLPPFPGVYWITPTWPDCSLFADLLER